MLELLAFDADDTLWHNETLYSQTQERFAALLANYTPVEQILERLYATEMRNLAHFGYGLKGFTLSMIETAIELTAGAVRGHDIQQIIDFAREMRAAPVELLPGVAETVAHLADSYRLMLITKGDLFDQETKLARSGLGEYFAAIEIVSDKTPASYQRILARQQVAPQHFVMVGNSLRSDILPVLAIGGQAVYIPYSITWAHEEVAPHEHHGAAYHQLAEFGQLPRLLAELG